MPAVRTAHQREMPDVPLVALRTRYRRGEEHRWEGENLLQRVKSSRAPVRSTAVLLQNPTAAKDVRTVHSWGSLDRSSGLKCRTFWRVGITVLKQPRVVHSGLRLSKPAAAGAPEGPCHHPERNMDVPRGYGRRPDRYTHAFPSGWPGRSDAAAQWLNQSPVLAIGLVGRPARHDARGSREAV